MRVILTLLLLLVAAAGAATAWLARDLDRFRSTPLAIGEEGLEYTIEPGTNLRGIAGDLARRGLLEEPQDVYYLIGLARWHKLAQKVKAGEYRLASGLLPEQFLDRIVRGDVTQYSLTLVEGWTFAQARNAVRAHPKLRHTLPEELTGAQLMKALGLAEAHPEGLFLPDTYHFPAGTGDADFLRRAYRAMQRLLSEEWQHRAPDLPYADPYQALIMASIIEKETGAASERPEIAGVMIRRLRKGMMLQTDPTVIYGLGESFDGDLRRRDLKRDTPYNTYTRHGLPPTPIALPGAASIHAALHPADGRALYFVAKGNGTHYFSKTLKEHNRAVRRYQLQQ
jgi:UPF0755 protein